MRNILYKSVLALTMAASISSCSFFELETVEDPNNASVGSVTNNATRAQLQNLIYGLESRNRDYLFVTTALYGAFGRELWYLNQSDPRFSSNWLGQRNIRPDGQFFFTAGAYNSPYQAVRQAHLVIASANNSSIITEEERNGYRGFSNTIKAYQLLTPANGLYNNGIRIDVENVENPGPFTPDYQASLAGIKAVLDQGNQELSGAGGTFAFQLSSGFAGFNTPENMRKVNRAIAARIAIYRKDWQGALDALNQSFFDLAGDLNAGPAHSFGAPPDVFNPLFYPKNTAITTMIAVHPSLIQDALPNDRRVEQKFLRRTTPVTITDGAVTLVGEYQDNRYPAQTSPVKFIRNEELILIYAEAQAQLGNATEAVNAINVIRNAAGVGAYTGGTDLTALINEILFQRRYSLWAEPGGHRWVDLRRYDRLTEIPVDLDAGAAFIQLERPIAETNWDSFYGG
jgi:starch-binding outer membrane protein, SusD/RagB family